MQSDEEVLFSFQTPRDARAARQNHSSSDTTSGTMSGSLVVYPRYQNSATETESAREGDTETVRERKGTEERASERTRERERESKGKQAARLFSVTAATARFVLGATSKHRHTINQ